MPQQCAQQNIETKAQQQSPYQKSKLKHAAPPPPKKINPIKLNPTEDIF